jgi:hypothetical protein
MELGIVCICKSEEQAQWALERLQGMHPAREFTRYLRGDRWVVVASECGDLPAMQTLTTGLGE